MVRGRGRRGRGRRRRICGRVIVAIGIKCQRSGTGRGADRRTRIVEERRRRTRSDTRQSSAYRYNPRVSLIRQLSPTTSE